ncbi:MAG: histidine phosphatase family protein [Pseudomonadota bacterium]
MKPDGGSNRIGRRGPIIVGRHGRPALDRTAGPKLGWQDYVAWWDAYEAGGLAGGQSAPRDLVALVADADVLLTSGRRRAHETINEAAQGRIAEALSLYNEAPLPPPRFKRAKFLPKTWNVLARIAWLMGHSLGDETVGEARARAGVAARALHDASVEGKVYLAAHGWFNRMIRKELRKLGWRCRYNGGDKYWAWRIYEFPGD